MTVVKAVILANAFIDSEINYAPIVWMFAGKTLISKISKIHYRTLKVVYNEHNKESKGYKRLLFVY